MDGVLGRLMRLQLRETGDWLSVEGERTTRYKISRDHISVTAGEVWRTGIAGGLSGLSVSASGVLRRGAGTSLLKLAAWTGDAVNVRVIDSEGIVFDGSAFVGSFSRSAEHDGAELWSVNLTVSAAPAFGGTPEIPVTGDLWAIAGWSLSPGVSTTIVRAPQRVITGWSITT